MAGVLTNMSTELEDGDTFEQDGGGDMETFAEDISFYHRNWTILSPEYHRDFKLTWYQVLEEDNSRKLQLIIEEGFGANFVFPPSEYLNFPTKQTVLSSLRQFGVGQYDMTPLHLALALYSPDRPTNRCAELLLRRGAADHDAGPLNPKRMDLMYMAYKTGNVEGVNLLFEYGQTADDEIFLDLIHKRPQPESLEILKILLQHGDPLDRAFYQSNYLLHIAALDRYENTAYLELLVSSGADINVTNVAGYTAVFSAASMGNLAAFQFLHKHGCSVNVETKDRCSPLHLAFRNQMTKCVPALIELVDDINKVDLANHTALDYAMICGPVFHEFNKSAQFFKNESAEKYIRLMLNNGAVLNKFDREDFKTFLKRFSRKFELLGLLCNVFPNWKFVGFTDYPEHLCDWEPGFASELLQLGQEPRSLKHFCRHSLRVSLGKKYVATVERSKLPKRLQKYLLFDDPKDIL